MERISLALAVPFVLLCGAASCGGNYLVSNVVDVDAGDDADADVDAGIPCDATNVSKGPWTLAMTETSITIRWEECRGPLPAEVTLTSENGDLGETASTVGTPYVVSETFTAPLNVNAPPDLAGTYYMHEATFSNLTPGTCYGYFLDQAPDRKGRFCTARPSGDPFRFLAIGDTNPSLGTSTQSILQNVLPKKADFNVHVGDIQYYDSTVETWGSWFQVMQPYLWSGAFFPAIGNHEAEKDTEYKDYVIRFFGGAGFDSPMPADSGDQYYRYESGGVWFFTLDTELPLDANSDQAKWLEAELADANAKPGFRFAIVYFHKPFVTCGDTGDNPDARAVFEPMFAKYKVPLVLQGHMHGYERFTFPGLTYVTVAGGGGALGDVSQNVARPECTNRTNFGRVFSATVFDVGATTIHGETITDGNVTQDSFDVTLP